MGTRCITEIRSRWNEDEFKTHAVVYRHWDGYLEGHGKWLYEFLNSVDVVNGITVGKKYPKKIANGPGRLAAQMVYELQKDGHDPDLHTGNGPCGQEYHYVVDVEYGYDGGSLKVTVYDGPVTAFGEGGEDCTRPLFSGSVEEYGEFLKNHEEIDE